MEGTMAEIRLFAPDFAPKYWAYCQGQILAISTNSALFALLGTTYGGNGQTTFALPDFRGRTAVSPGQAPGTSNYVLGEMIGVENTTLISTQLPVHTHTVQVTNQSGSVAIGAANNDADQKTPVNNYAAITDNVNIYSSTTDASLISSPVNVVGSINCSISGNSQPHENRQPFLALNYIICQYGIFPSRN